MSTYDYAGNLHVHTSYSDGTGLHSDVAEAAAQAGLDFVIVTDHNVWVDGMDDYYGDVLVLVGEEIHASSKLRVYENQEFGIEQ